MSISLPSKEIYAIDVPEVQGFEASFQYNFFTPDESVSETGGVPQAFLTRPADAVDAAFSQYAVTRAPRYVNLNFKLPRIASPAGANSDLDQRNHTFTSHAQNGSLISDNIDKVVSEDNFAGNNYIAVNFHDGEIDDKLHYLVSGSYAMQTLTQPVDRHVSPVKAAYHMSIMTPKSIKPHYLFKMMALPAQTSGVRFFYPGNRLIVNNYFKRIKDVATNAQVNSKLFHDITNRTIKDPQSPFTTDLVNLHKFTKKLQHQVVQRLSPLVSEADFKTFVPFIDVKVRRTAFHHDQRGAEIVGYIIDKTEVLPGGQTRALPPIIVDNAHINRTSDFRVKYNATYCYSIRAIAQFTMPAIDDDTGDIGTVKVLVSSKPSNKVYVRTVEEVAPPAPTDLNFTWDYERVNPLTAQHDSTTGEALPGTGRPGSLLIHWTFPPNSQRDIKKFQVFRRRDTNHPFELIKMYDFDDSLLKFAIQENPNPRLVEHLTSPANFFYDDDFQVGNHDFHDPYGHGDDQFGRRPRQHHPGSSTFIYAVACIDAHGYTSGYSAQYEVWFDEFKNSLQKRLISHGGAPKPYPNLYLEADTFVDTIRASGPGSKRLKLYFNPEFYYVYDDSGRSQRVLATEQTGGKYRLQFINVDNQKSAGTDIVINDQVRAALRTLAFPEIRFSARRRVNLRKITSQ